MQFDCTNDLKNYIKKKFKIDSLLELKLLIITYPGYLIRPFPSLIKKIILLLTKFLEGRTGAYFDYKFYPIEPKNFKRPLLEKDTKYKIGIVVQGPIIKKNNLTENVIKQLRKITCSKNKILLSTWEEDLLLNNHQQTFNKITDVIIKNTKPKFYGPNNVNLQITSTLNGIEYFEKKKFNYVLKIRTDQIYYSENILNFLEDLINFFKINKKINQRTNIHNKIVTCQPKSNEIFSINDQFMFASIKDLKNYWNRESLFSKKKFLDKDNADTKIFENYGIESYLYIKFLKKINYKFELNLSSYKKSINDLCCLVDVSMLDRYWKKYSFERNFETISSKFGIKAEQLYFYENFKKRIL